jgi:CubicO group peptidase (beta-lactamase class C family)
VTSPVRPTKWIVAVVFLALTLGACDSGQTLDDRVAAIESAISSTIIIRGETPPAVSLEERMSRLNVPGLSVAVISDGEIEWAKAYGFADVEDQRRATTETLFQAASISKPVAAMAVLKLAEDGVVDLDQNVNDMLTSWQIPDNEFTVEQKVTLRGLLNHSAGTTVWGFAGYENGTDIPTTIDVLEGAGNSEAVRVWKEPGESWRYSGGGYTVMELLIGDALQQPFPQLMKEIVLEPLEMSSSTYEQPLPALFHERAASGYDTLGNRINGKWHVYPEMAAAGLWTTPSDLARYIIEVQQAYRGNGRILSESTTKMMLQAGMNDHGLGPIIQDPGLRFGHGGSNAGFKSSFTAFTEQGAGVIVMTNADNGAQLAEELILTIGQAYGWSGFAPEEKVVVNLDPGVYESLVGRYQLTDAPVVVDVTYDEGRLMAQATGEEAFELLPEGELLFFSRDGLSVEFERTDSSVTAMIVSGGAIRAERITQ